MFVGVKWNRFARPDAGLEYAHVLIVQSKTMVFRGGD